MRLLPLAVLLSAFSAYSGTITGNYWYYGVSNLNPTEGKDFLDSLKDHKPWKDLPAARTKLRQHATGATMAADLKIFHDSVKSGDTFIFYYGGHTSMVADDNGDEGAGGQDLVLFDESDKTSLLRDDQLASDAAFGSFPKCSTVILIINACFAAKLLDGTSDLKRGPVADKHHILFIGSPSSENGCSQRDAAAFPSIILSALEAAQKNDKQAHGKEWATEIEKSYKDAPLKPTVYDNLDAEHDRTVANTLDHDDDEPEPVPEPDTLVAVLSALLLFVATRRSTRG
jgi:hypothetical protein